jgi:hypothetical protein
MLAMYIVKAPNPDNVTSEAVRLCPRTLTKLSLKMAPIPIAPPLSIAQ